MSSSRAPSLQASPDRRPVPDCRLDRPIAVGSRDSPSPPFLLQVHHLHLVPIQIHPLHASLGFPPAASAAPLRHLRRFLALAGWIMSPVLLAARHAHLSTQVLLLRCFAMAILSLVIPLTFLTARSVFRHDATALRCAAVVAAMPGFLIGIARVSNEYLAVVLFSLLLWLSVGELTRRRLVAIGAVLGLGLLAKAYFLAAIPPVAVLLFSRCRHRRALLVPAATLAIAGWWYVRNLIVTATLSGMQESAMQPSATLGAQLHQATRVPWLATIDSIL